MKKTANPAWMYVVAIFAALLFALIIFNTVLSVVTPEVRFSRPISIVNALEFRENIEYLKFILSSINMVLLVYVLYNYVKIYRDVRSQFALGLIIMVSALLVHTITSSPLVSQLFGFRGTGLGPFAVIPSFFTLIAAVVLIYLSQQ